MEKGQYLRGFRGLGDGTRLFRAGDRRRSEQCQRLHLAWQHARFDSVSSKRRWRPTSSASRSSPCICPCVNNRPYALVALGRFEEALAMYRQDLGRGLSLYGLAPDPSLGGDGIRHPFHGGRQSSRSVARLSAPGRTLCRSSRSRGDYAELVAEALQYLPKTPTDVGQQITDSDAGARWAGTKFTGWVAALERLVPALPPDRSLQTDHPQCGGAGLLAASIVFRRCAGQSAMTISSAIDMLSCAAHETRMNACQA
jgi:hypothetical protein